MRNVIPFPPSLRIVLAAPDSALRTWLTVRLARLGAAVLAVTHAWQLLDTLADAPAFDLAVVDGEPGGPSGIQVAAMARGAGLHLPFLVLEERWPPAAPHRVDRVVLVPKPVDPGAIVSGARELLSASSPVQRRSHAS